jgi:hypothetical protein
MYGDTAIFPTFWKERKQTEPRHDKTNIATSMDPDQLAPPRSLIRIHAVRYQFI